MLSTSASRPDFWPDAYYAHTEVSTSGWLRPLPSYWLRFLQQAELALVDESCPSEIRLHRQLLANPLMAVSAATLALLRDPDVRDNYRMFLRWRDAVLQAGTLEQFYLDMLRRKDFSHPPVFVGMLLQTLARHILRDSHDALQARCAELWFRPQRLSLQDGQWLSVDAQALQTLQGDGGLGELGRLLKESQAPLRPAQLRVLGPDTLATYWSHSAYRFVLDLSHETSQTLSHGLTLHLAKARSGLTALSQVMAMWVQHMLGVAVRITPVHDITDAQWRWHTGLDSTSSALLNALYQGQDPGAAQARLVSLFSLRFEDSAQVQPEMVNKPVYLGLAAAEDHSLHFKPQNLLLNLPLLAV